MVTVLKGATRFVRPARLITMSLEMVIWISSGAESTSDPLSPGDQAPPFDGGWLLLDAAKIVISNAGWLNSDAGVLQLRTETSPVADSHALRLQLAASRPAKKLRRNCHDRSCRIL